MTKKVKYNAHARRIDGKKKRNAAFQMQCMHMMFITVITRGPTRNCNICICITYNYARLCRIKSDNGIDEGRKHLHIFLKTFKSMFSVDLFEGIKAVDNKCNCQQTACCLEVASKME